MTNEDKVIAWQQTGNEQYFNEVYTDLVAEIVYSKGSRYESQEVDSRMNQMVYDCFVKYDRHKNDNFEAYLRQHLNYAVKRGCGTDKQLTDREHLIDYETLDSCDCFLGAESAANMQHFQDKLGMSEDECYLVEQLGAGYRAVDIAGELGCSVSAISHRVKALRRDHPELLDYLM